MKLSKLNISISAFPVGSRYDFPSNTALHACHQISFSYVGGWKPCSYLLSPHRAVFVNESFLYGMHSSLHVMQGGGGVKLKAWKRPVGPLDVGQGEPSSRTPTSSSAHQLHPLHPGNTSGLPSSGAGTESRRARLPFYNNKIAKRLRLWLSLIKRQPENCPLPRAPALSL